MFFGDVEIWSVCVCLLLQDLVCVFYYCRTYYKAVRVGGGGECHTRSVWHVKILKIFVFLCFFLKVARGPPQRMQRPECVERLKRR